MLGFAATNPTSMPWLELPDLRLHYRCLGAGSPLLMLHSLASSGDDWAFQEPAFSARHRLILPDLRGFGRSDKPLGPYRIGQMAEDMRALLRHLGIDRCHLLGFSMGGAVAFQLATDEPARFASLTVVNALPSYQVDDWRKAIEVFASLAMVHVLGMRRMGELVARRNFPLPEQAPMRRRLIEVFARNPRHAYLAGARALIGWSVEQRLGEIECPVLVVAGSQDYTPLEGKRAYCAKLRRGELRVFEGSRHGTPFDRHQAFNATVLEFLARVEAERAQTPR